MKIKYLFLVMFVLLVLISTSCVTINNQAPTETSTTTSPSNTTSKPTPTVSTQPPSSIQTKGGIHLVYQADLSNVFEKDQAMAIDADIAIINSRLEVFGIANSVIQKENMDRIIVEIPQIKGIDLGYVATVIGQTSILEFGELASSDSDTAIKWTNEYGKWKPALGTLNGVQKELTSRYFKQNTSIQVDNLGKIYLVFDWDSEGSQLCGQITQRLLQQQLGFFSGSESLMGDDGKPIAAVVQAQIMDRGQIAGLSRPEATKLSKLLNIGYLPVPLVPIYEQTLTPNNKQ